MLSPIPGDPHNAIIFSSNFHNNAYVFVDTPSILSPKPSIKFLYHLNALHNETIIKFVNVECQKGLGGVFGFKELRNVFKEDLGVWKPR